MPDKRAPQFFTSYKKMRKHLTRSMKLFYICDNKKQMKSARNISITCYQQKCDKQMISLYPEIEL
jgi:hypothetical protein